jgi:uncharacterized protein YdhG (YjbR/CyaY superfamily)
MKSKATTPDAYVASLPADRREAIAKVRAEIVRNLPNGYEETVEFGLIAYVVPLDRFPCTYNGHPLMYAALASQKQHMAVYLTNVYGHPATAKWFQSEYKKSGKRLDMGKSCVRFRKLDDLPLELIGRTIARTPLETFVRYCEAHYSKPKKKSR